MKKKRRRVTPPAKVGELFEETCRHCGGSGQEPGMRDLTCRECIGRGRRRWRVEACPDCTGTGRKRFIFTCKPCQGQGWRKRDVG